MRASCRLTGEVEASCSGSQGIVRPVFVVVVRLRLPEFRVLLSDVRLYPRVCLHERYATCDRFIMRKLQ
jgi:hypothetical protein